jgi:serine/threonine-protein kinase
MPGNAVIVIRALGPVEVRVNGAPAPTSLLWKKNLALLVYLARSPKRVRTRQHLMVLLWGEKPDDKARHSLTVAISTLRNAAGDGLLDSDADQVRLPVDDIVLDTDMLETRAAAGDYAGAAELVSGEFLEGFVIKEASEFEDWLHFEREHWRRRSIDVLVKRVEQLLAAGSLDAANDMVARARKLDWRPEIAVRAAMKGLALAGDRAGALALFDEFAARLKDELHTEPDTETQALAQRVRQERTWRLPTAGVVASTALRVPLVGRSAELARLVEVWTTCLATRRGAVAVIEGDDGIGKTRLAEEVAVRARLDGAIVTALRAVAADRVDAWSGVLGIARAGLLDATGAATATPWMLDQLKGTKPLETPGRALSDLLHAVADDQPVLAFVDDAHWLDRNSLLALGAAARDLNRAPVLCLLTAGRQPPCPELDDLRTRIGREVAGVVVKLQVFDDRDVRELSRNVLPSYTPEKLDQLARRVLADTAGIPLLVAALISAVAGGLQPNERASAWPETNRTLVDTLPGELPDNVVAAIRVNFRRLSPSARQVLVAAAVLGGRQSVDTLELASRMTTDALAEALDELEWHRWLTVERRGYAFVARIVRDIVDRDMVVKGERQRIKDAARSSAGDGPSAS